MKKICVGIILMVISVVGICQKINLIPTESGVFKIACKFNGVPMDFIFDTGAYDVTISSTEAMFLAKNGLLDYDDLIGKGLYRTANGQVDTSTLINIRRLEIGTIVLTNVKGSVIESDNGMLLLGQSALQKLGPIIIDFDKKTLVVKNLPKEGTKRKLFRKNNVKRVKYSKPTSQ